MPIGTVDVLLHNGLKYGCWKCGILALSDDNNDIYTATTPLEILASNVISMKGITALGNLENFVE